MERSGYRQRLAVDGEQQWTTARTELPETADFRPRAPRHVPLSGVLVMLLLAACGGAPSPPPPARPYADPGFVASGEFALHYALTPTLDLPAEIAGSYGIVQRRNLALLTITLVRRAGPGSARVAVRELDATAVSLTGERRALALTRHDDAGGPTWLATVEVRHRVPVTIEIHARATAESPGISTRWTREFHLD